MLKTIKIYKSSAGSGKTYTLSKNYIRLALKNKNYFRKILAVTFTNKAAEEMKSRILEMISSISAGEDKNLIIELSKYFNISSEELSIKAKNLKINILHNYSYFNITTIDSFFYSIIQSFTRDLKFRGKYNIEMDLEFVINEVVSSFLSDLNKGEKITKWLIDFSRDKINSGKDFMINNELKNITKILFTEDYKSIPKMSSSGNYIDQIDLLRKKINSNKKRFEEEVIRLSSELISLIKKNNLDEKDFSFGHSGIFGFILKNSKGEIKYPSKRIISCLNNPEKWLVKNYSKRDRVLEYIKKLDQSDRKILRDLGVKFGRYHVFLYKLIKPFYFFFFATLLALTSFFPKYSYGITTNVLKEKEEVHTILFTFKNLCMTLLSCYLKKEKEEFFFSSLYSF